MVRNSSLWNLPVGWEEPSVHCTPSIRNVTRPSTPQEHTSSPVRLSRDSCNPHTHVTECLAGSLHSLLLLTFYRNSHSPSSCFRYSFPTTRGLAQFALGTAQVQCPAPACSQTEARALGLPWAIAGYPGIDRNRVAWRDLFVINPCWLLPITLLSPRKCSQID